MRLFRREEEGGFTVADWDDGFVGLSRNEARKSLLDFHFERWQCCPGAFELKIELFGLMFVVYNEGGPCQLEAYLADEEEDFFELAPPIQVTTPDKGNDWHPVPAPAGR
jgi:hypothetical protein